MLLSECYWRIFGNGAKGLEDLEIKGDPFSASVGCLIVITTPYFFSTIELRKNVSTIDKISLLARQHYI